MPRAKTFIPASPEFGDFVRNLRHERHLSLAEVANGKYTRATIHLIERGSSGVSEAMASHLAERLQVPVGELERYRHPDDPRGSIELVNEQGTLLWRIPQELEDQLSSLGYVGRGAVEALFRAQVLPVVLSFCSVTLHETLEQWQEGARGRSSHYRNADRLNRIFMELR